MISVVGLDEAAQRLGVSTRTVQRWLRSGRLPAIRVGTRLKVSTSAFAQVRPIRRLLVANRAELVARIASTCRTLGIACLALVTDDQRDTWWSAQADETVPLDTTYLDGAAIVAAAVAAGADAIHPGYGFLAEQADFAEAVAAAGLVWIGPPPAAMRALGDKAAARRLAASMDVPILSGFEGRGQSDAVLAREAARIGYPVILKPSAGGGGKGMHVVRERSELREALARARREAKAAFGDARLIIERYLDRPRHVEVQLLLDGLGGGVHVGVRDCSLQRRHQKVVEEAPAPGLDAATNERLGAAALRLARAAGYVGAGTAEFLLDDDGSFVFLELNARLQVEHPVTEAVTGIDLVAAQLRIAAGEPLGLMQSDVKFHGHAIEARLYAEDPWAGFVPAIGRVGAIVWPAGPGLRIDAGVGLADEIGTRYDPLLAKVIAHGADRAEALGRLEHALAATRVVGVTTNRGFLRTLLAWPEVVAGDARTDTIGVRWHPGVAAVPEAAWAAAAEALATVPGAPSGFRLNAPRSLPVEIGGEQRVVKLSGTTVPSSGDGPFASIAFVVDGDGVVLDIDGQAFRAHCTPAPSVDGALRRARHAVGSAAAISAPMPGVVLAVRVAEGESVEAHQILVVLEAMKMENAVTAPVDGTVARVLVRAGQAVQRGDVLVELGD
ncbi:MAG: biotin carboxylase N-terminal domain-containing protein [Candidatus Limnocylindrales bacterium]